MKYSIYLFITFLFLSLGIPTYSQGFKAALIAGMNASQIDGDNLYGFNKLGLSVGGRLGYKTDKSYDIALEMLYSQRGSTLNTFNSLPSDRIGLNYFEIPIIFNLRDWYIEKEDYFKVRVETGFSYGYLFQIEAVGFNESYFKKHDISWLIGAGLNINKMFGVGIRYSTSLFKMYEVPNTAENSLLSYFLTLRTEVNF